MTIHATGSFEVKSWNEQPYSEIDGQPKLTRAEVVYAYHGDFEGEGSRLSPTLSVLACLIPQRGLEVVLTTRRVCDNFSYEMPI